jgi:tetratricopeptide (TPR) repeat protein
MGYLEFTEGDPTKATRWYGRAIAVDPKRPDAYLQQGDLYFRKRRFDDALIWYEKAASVAPENFAAALQAGLCALSLDDRNTAERYFVQANEADPSRWQPLYSLACVRAQQQDSDAALGYLEAAVGKGFRNASRMRSDPCILSLAGEPRFIDLMRTMGHSGAD